MKTKMRRWKTGMGAAALALSLLGLAGRASAAGVTDSITVTITPTASYSITITTAPSGANLGAVPLNTSTYTALASTVSVDSTYAWTGLSLAGSVQSPAGTPWTLVSTNAPVLDGLSAWVLFTDTSVATAPAPSVLTSSNAVVGTGLFTVGGTGSAACPQGSGTVGVGPHLFELASGAGLKRMECLPASSVDTYGSQPHLFLYFKTPSATTDATHAQLVTFTLTAGAPQ